MKISNKIKYIIFDYNGTLTNDAAIGHKACNHMLKFYNVPQITFEQFKKTFTTPWINFYILNNVKETRIDIKRHQEEYQKVHTQLAREELGLNIGVMETLKYLKQKGFSLSILSSRNIQDLTNEINSLRITEFFDVVMGEDNLYEDGIRAEKQTSKLIKKLNINSPSEVFYIGDTIADIEIAQKYNFTSGIITTGWQDESILIRANPSHIFKNFIEIKELFT